MTELADLDTTRRRLGDRAGFRTEERVTRRRPTMAKYAFFFTYSSEAWARMMKSPGDRTAAVRQLTESVGGRLESAYWMFGAHDGFVVADVPDSVSAAAVSVAVGSSGSFKHLETHELLTQDQLGQVLSRASDSTKAYQPPGQQG
jgi:uncharacterized protein with GYD domain